jgi:peptidoglycan/LPS O-acetylase OafA/YrhL
MEHELLEEGRIHLFERGLPEKEQPLLRPHMPELDSVRGIAVLMVILMHGFFWSADMSRLHGIGKLIVGATQGGLLGVQLFFVLSGFLITGILLDTKGHPDYFKRFYWRRALRILPAYGALIVVLLMLGAIQWQFALVSILFLSNFSPFFRVAMQYGPLWSLAVEEQFYLIWPSVVYRLSMRTLALLALLIVVTVPIIRGIAFSAGLAHNLYYYTWFVVDGLAAGALLAIYLRTQYATHRAVFSTGVALVAIGSAILLLGIPFGILHRTNLIGAIFQFSPWQLIFTGGIALVLLAGVSSFKHLILIKWLRYIGKISYGLYLIHLLVFSQFDMLAKYFLHKDFVGTFPGLLFRFAIVMGVSILIAALSRRYFEEYFLRLKGAIHQKQRT